MKGKIIKQFQKADLTALFGFGGKSKLNSFMEFLVELENGKRVWMSKKDLKKIKLT